MQYLNFTWLFIDKLTDGWVLYQTNAEGRISFYLTCMLFGGGRKPIQIEGELFIWREIDLYVFAGRLPLVSKFISKVSHTFVCRESVHVLPTRYYSSVKIHLLASVHWSKSGDPWGSITVSWWRSLVSIVTADTFHSHQHFVQFMWNLAVVMMQCDVGLFVLKKERRIK